MILLRFCPFWMFFLFVATKSFYEIQNSFCDQVDFDFEAIIKTILAFLIVRAIKSARTVSVRSEWATSILTITPV